MCLVEIITIDVPVMLPKANLVGQLEEEEGCAEVPSLGQAGAEGNLFINQDFRLCGHESLNSRCSQFSPQVIAQQIIFGLIKRFSESLCFHLQRKPGMIATSDMVTL